ncbi:MAG TPA: hypothetical protein VNX68_10710 [Nitrosopumilaceae archaeon]|jgi:hypothetical protein|nr:hypothetical protein [Nitrosopumilaceae archaeon]
MAKMYIKRTWDSYVEDWQETFYVVEPEDDLDWINEEAENGPIFEVPDELAEKYNLIWYTKELLEKQIRVLEP